MAAAAMSPPTTPPAMAAVLEDLEDFDSEVWLSNELVGDVPPFVLDWDPDELLPELDGGNKLPRY